MIIDPAKGYTGEFTVNVTVSDGAYSSSKSFKVSVANAAPQRLSLSTDSLPGLNEDYATPAVFPLSARDVLYALDTYWRANLQNVSSSAQSNEITASSYQGNLLSGLFAALPAPAVKSVFHDNRIQDNSWWLDRIADLGYWSPNALDHSPGLQKELTSGRSQDLSRNSGLNSVIGSAFSEDVEDALKSWENQLSEREVRDNLFALLGQE